MAERLFRPHFKGRAAWVVPPVSNYSNGPCGFTYNPGTALSEKYRGFFFHAQGKTVSAFRATEKGSSVARGVPCAPKLRSEHPWRPL